MSTSKPHFSTLDALRGVAALAVVIHHCGPLFGSGLTMHSGFLAVDLFFLLSGFVLEHAYGRRFGTGLAAMTFMKLRLQRLWPVFFVGILISIFGQSLAHASGSNYAIPYDKLVPSMMLNSAFLPAPSATANNAIFPLNTPAWSLFFELLVNVAFVVFWKRLNTVLLLSIIALSGIWLVAVTFYYGTMDIGWTWPTFSAGFARVSFSFFAGVLLYRHANKETRRISINPMWLLLVVPLLSLINFNEDGPLQASFDLICAMIVFPGLIYLGANNEPSEQHRETFMTLGALSYPIYAVHVPMLFLFTAVLTRLLGAPERVAPFGGIAFVVLVSVAAWIINSAFDRKVQDAFKRRRGNAIAQASFRG